MDGHRHINHARREMIAVAQGSSRTHAHLRRRLLTIFLVTVFFAVLSTLVVYFTEHGAKGGEIHSLFDAFLFSTSQLLTASSVANPKTNAGKVIELFFDIYAITVVATLAGSFGAFFHARSKEMDRLEEEMKDGEHRLMAEAKALEERLEGHPSQPDAEPTA
ncbi:MAG TPA: hypothetical protein VF731_12655 [Solirubrobacterales bacterium]